MLHLYPVPADKRDKERGPAIYITCFRKAWERTVMRTGFQKFVYTLLNTLL